MGIERHRRIEPMSRREAGTLVPVGARDDVSYPVSVEIAERGSLAEEVVGEGDLLEGEGAAGGAAGTASGAGAGVIPAGARPTAATIRGQHRRPKKERSQRICALYPARRRPLWRLYGPSRKISSSFLANGSSSVAT